MLPWPHIRRDRSPPDLPENVSLEQFLDCDRADAISEATVEREQ